MYADSKVISLNCPQGQLILVVLKQGHLTRVGHIFSEHECYARCWLDIRGNSIVE